MRHARVIILLLIVGLAGCKTIEEEFIDTELTGLVVTAGMDGGEYVSGGPPARVTVKLTNTGMEAIRVVDVALDPRSVSLDLGAMVGITPTSRLLMRPIPDGAPPLPVITLGPGQSIEKTMLVVLNAPGEQIMRAVYRGTLYSNPVRFKVSPRRFR